MSTEVKPEIDEQESLDEFLVTDEAKDLKNADIAVRFNCHEGTVRRARIKLGLYTPKPHPEKPEGPAEEAEEPPAEILLPDGLPPGERLLTIDELDLDSGTKVRDLVVQHVEDLVDVIQRRKSSSSLGVLGAMWTTDLEKLVLYDGFHRTEAARRVLGDRAAFLVDVKVGTLEDAIVEAFRANRKHGQKLSQEDRRAIIVRVLEDPRWGPDWSNSKIAELTGDHRVFIKQVRKEWLKSQNLQDPETRTVQRGDQTYQQRVPRRNGDAAEGDDLADETQEDQDPTITESASDRQARIDAEYLMAIPMRAHLHEKLLDNFDQTALAHRDIIQPLTSISNWLIRYKDKLGEDNPLYVQLDRLGRIPYPIVVGDEKNHRSSWVACQNCKDEATGKTTGFTPDGEPCKTCSGTGIRLPGKR